MTRDYKEWCGFTFNPGLRRTSDCMRLHPYANLEQHVEKNGFVYIGEVDLSLYYRELEYSAAITSDAEGYVKHIGWGRHILLPGQKPKKVKS